jgi:hypothetical protein
MPCACKGNAERRRNSEAYGTEQIFRMAEYAALFHPARCAPCASRRSRSASKRAFGVLGDDLAAAGGVIKIFNNDPRIEQRE